MVQVPLPMSQIFLLKADLLDTMMKFYAEEVQLSPAKAALIEEETQEQSSCLQWETERKKRITASNACKIAKQRSTTPLEPLVKQLLYNTFKGNCYTSYSLEEEKGTQKEYLELHKQAGCTKCEVKEADDSVGLIEIKNLLHKKGITLKEAATKSSFCLQLKGDKLTLKKSHD